MLTLEQIQKALKDRRPGMISQATGLSINTISEIRNGIQINPSYQTLKALSDYLEGKTNA